MTNTVTESTVTEPVEQTAPVPAAEPVTFDADYVKKLRDESARYRNQAKQNADAAARLAELEDAQKSQEQRLTEQLDAAQRDAADAKQQLLRAEVAAQTGVPAALLAGATREELEAHAAALVEFRGKPAAEASYVIPAEGGSPAPLNGAGIEQSLRTALGIN